MKLIIFPLLIACIGIAEAKVYKCQKKEEGSYIYQSKPCPNRKGKPEDDELKIIPADEEKIKAALEKLDEDLAAHQAKKDEAAKKEQKDKESTPLLNQKQQTKPEKKVRKKRWTDRRKQ